MMPNDQVVLEFQEIVWRYYGQHGRDLPWRKPEANGQFDAYKIMVSEIMLQQTQVGRVMPKCEAFLQAFPNVRTLAQASLAEVLKLWNGLGYNRRAKFLWQAANMVAENYQGQMPRNVQELQALPGIGHNTAAAIAVYAYDSPEVFVETNIRTVYLHHFFQDRTDIHDKEILELVSITLPEDHFREWYWALMDYGTYLKATVGNLNNASKHYAKQSKFEGSKRQVRGAVLRLLGGGSMSFSELQANIQDDRLPAVLDELVKEQMIRQTSEKYHL